MSAEICTLTKSLEIECYYYDPADPCFIGTTPAPKFKGFVYDERATSFSGPFAVEGLTSLTTKDDSDELYCTTEEGDLKRTSLLEFNDPKLSSFTDPFTDLDQPFGSAENPREPSLVLSSTGNGFLYRGRFRPLPFSNPMLGGGIVCDPVYFGDSYLSILETNFIHLGDEHNEKQIYRIDLSFHKNSCGHVFCWIENEEGKFKGQYKGMCKEHMKVFTNLRGRRFRICLMVATHKSHPWALREMSIGHLYGKSF